MADDPLIEPESDKRIAALARELAEAINEGQDQGRGSLRDYAIDVLRETVGEDVPIESAGAAAGAKPKPLNPLSLGLPMLLVAALLLFFFPAMGLLFLIGGLVASGLGAGMAITAARRRRALAPKA
jgi:hypothetical protein